MIKYDRPLIIGYLPPSASGWILEFLFKDISRYSHSAEYIFTTSILDLVKYSLSRKNSHILCLHYGIVRKLVF